MTAKVYAGRVATKQLTGTTINKNEYAKLLKKIEEGLLAETIVINYFDTLITAMNIRMGNQANEVPDPHPCSIDIKNILPENYDNDYEQIQNCCQRHSCRLAGYCKSSKIGVLCRFGFPQPLLEKTELVFTETESKVKAELNHKRNDPHINQHNRLICHHWRANVDMQGIIDVQAAINYMVKYATKGSKTFLAKI